MLEFECSYRNLDIWKEIDTQTGVVEYMFYFDNQTYKADTLGRIKSTAAFVQTNKLKTNKQKEQVNGHTL